MIGFRGKEVDTEVGGVAEGTNFKGIARGNSFRDGWNITPVRGVEGKAFVVEPVDAIGVAECAIEIVAWVVKTRNKEVGESVAFVGSAGCGHAAKTIDPLWSIAGGPVHVLVAKGHVAAVDDGVWAVGNDELKSIEFVAVKSVVTDVYPIDVYSCWGNFIEHLPVAIARIDIGPKRRHNSVACRRKGSGRKGRKRTCEGNVTVIVNVDGVVSLAIQIKGEWYGYNSCRAVVVGLHSQSVGGVWRNIAVAGIGFVVSGWLDARDGQLNCRIGLCIDRP